MNWLRAILRSLGWERQAARKVDPTPVVMPPATDLIGVINEVRARHGVGPVIEDERLDQASKIQADHQAAVDQLTHDGPSSLPWVMDRLKAAGVSTWLEGDEICAMGQRAFWPDGSLAIGYDFRKTCQDWLSSPGHRAILLDIKFTHAGAYATTNKHGRTYSTAVFVRRS
jgi:uncharacterized protein YkwD